MFKRHQLTKFVILFVAFTAFKTEAKAARHGQYLADTTHRSSQLIVTKITDRVYQHTSFLNTNTFGRVSCNGMVVIDNNEAVIFDTPADDISSAELIIYVEEQLKAKIKAVVATHFHTDCVGGLGAFHSRKIPSYGSNLTISLAAKNKFPVPQRGFDNKLILNVGTQVTSAEFVGEGHTRDNVIGYFGPNHVVFGGCLVKEMGASKGNLADANTDAWPETIRFLKRKFPGTRVVIPGHGVTGGTELLDYTIDLFSK